MSAEIVAAELEAKAVIEDADAGDDEVDDIPGAGAAAKKKRNRKKKKGPAAGGGASSDGAAPSKAIGGVLLRVTQWAVFALA